MAKLQLPFLGVALSCFIAMPLAFCLPLAITGCGSLSGSQPLSQAATNAAPKLVAAIDGLKIVADNSGNTTIGEAADIAAALAIAGLGIWAKITHGQVTANTAAIAAQSPPAPVAPQATQTQGVQSAAKTL